MPVQHDTTALHPVARGLGAGVARAGTDRVGTHLRPSKQLGSF